METPVKDVTLKLPELHTDQHFANKPVKSEVEFWDAQATLPGFQGVVVDDDKHTSTKMLYHFIATQFDMNNKIILDIGCGVGRLFNIFVDSNAKEIHGVDHSINMIRVARFKFPQPNIFLHKMDSSNLLGIPDNKFDLVICNTVLCHIMDDTNISPTIREMVRVTVPNGIIFICEPMSINLFAIYEHAKMKVRTMGYYLRELELNYDLERLENTRISFGPIDHPDSLRRILIYSKKV